jgi:hypothetical protein
MSSQHVPQVLNASPQHVAKYLLREHPKGGDYNIYICVCVCVCVLGLLCILSKPLPASENSKS